MYVCAHLCVSVFCVGVKGVWGGCGGMDDFILNILHLTSLVFFQPLPCFDKITVFSILILLSSLYQDLIYKPNLNRKCHLICISKCYTSKYDSLLLYMSLRCIKKNKVWGSFCIFIIMVNFTLLISPIMYKWFIKCHVVF